jgi:hypothetical protein
MKSFVNNHFLSGKENFRFILFVISAFLLIIIAAANRNKPVQILPAQNQMMDARPKQSGNQKLNNFPKDNNQKERT